MRVDSETPMFNGREVAEAATLVEFEGATSSFMGLLPALSRVKGVDDEIVDAAVKAVQALYDHNCDLFDNIMGKAEFDD